MYKKVRLWAAVLAAVCCLLLLGGCMQREIILPEDELKTNTWCGKDEYNKQAELYFNCDNAVLTFKTDKTFVKVQGNAMVSDEKLVITDVALCQNITFSYKLYGDHIDLTYEGSTIKLDRKQ